MKHGINLFVIAAFLLASSGCTAVETATSAYGAVRAGYTAKSAAANVKDIKDAESVFAGYAGFVVAAELAPREGQAPTVQQAFQNSLVNQVRGYARAVGAPISACASAQSCAGRTVMVQFREEAYNANFAEKFTMGSKLKGKLLYVDVASGRVLAEKRIEGVSTYADALGMIRGSLSASMIKSYPQSQPTKEALESVPAVAPGYEKVLGSA